jgi:hypothetical protein
MFSHVKGVVVACYQCEASAEVTSEVVLVLHTCPEKAEG